jgi:hypothetical protein
MPVLSVDAHTTWLLRSTVVMAGVTFAVWAKMFLDRANALKRKHRSTASLTGLTTAQVQEVFEDSRASDNFKNLCELPVLFFAVVALSIVSNCVTAGQVLLAWGFVLLRAAHSWIQCTYNDVPHRFAVYFAAGWCLWLMWVQLAIQWL